MGLTLKPMSDPECLPRGWQRDEQYLRGECLDMHAPGARTLKLVTGATLPSSRFRSVGY